MPLPFTGIIVQDIRTDKCPHKISRWCDDKKNQAPPPLERKLEHDKSSQVKSSQVKSSQVKSSQVKSSQVGAGYDYP